MKAEKNMNWNEIRDWDRREPDPNVKLGNVVGVSFPAGYPQNLLRLRVKLSENSIPAVLKRNPGNEYDSNACEVWVDNEMIGHLAKEVAAEVAPRLDSGAEYTMEIVSVGFANEDPSKPGAGYFLELRG